MVKLAQQAKKAANEGKLIKLGPSNDFPKSMDILKQSLSQTTSDNLYSELKSYGNKGPLARYIYKDRTQTILYNAYNKGDP